MKEIHEYFTWIDWAVIIGYLGLTTIIGHMMRGKQGTIRDFFLGGRSLPWQAVSGSIIATEISGVTFIGVAGTLFALNGDFTYLLWGIGSVLGRVLVAKYIVPLYYEQEIYSPYDYMGRRLGSAAKKLATVVFTVGSILAQSVRVFVAAIPLSIVTPLDISWCIIIIGVIAITWTLMGGMQTVIWTDVMQFFLFTFGGLLALGWIISHLSGGMVEFIEVANTFNRMDTWDTRWGFGAELEYTLWVALLAVPFQNLTAFGVDQLNAQRMFCCRDAKAAAKALIWSSAGQVLTLLMLLVGAALFVHYNENPFTAAEAKVVYGVTEAGDAGLALAQQKMAEAPLITAEVATASDGVQTVESNVPLASKRDFIFPMWIVTQLPVGLSGLILAAIFAAAISSLDSILAALSQTSLSLIYNPENRTDDELGQMDLVRKSRILVCIWGVVLTVFTLGLVKASEGINLLSLAFGMTSYTVGPLLAIFFCAMLGRGTVRGLVIGFILSFLLTMFVRTDVWSLVFGFTDALAVPLSQLPTYDLVEPAAGAVDGKYGLKSVFNYAWCWPVTFFLTTGCGIIGEKVRAMKSA